METQAVQPMLRSLFLGAAVRPDEMHRSALAVLGSLPLVANALVTAAGKYVRVVTGTSDLAHTDGKAISLMNLPIPRDSGDIDTFVTMLALAYGLVHHEVGHVNHSDFTTKPRNANSMTPLVEELVGIIEDVRQENSQISRYPASRRYLDALNAVLQVTGHFQPVTSRAPVIKAFTGYLLYRLYRDYRGDATVADLVEPAEEVIRKKLPAGVLIGLDALLPRMRQLHDTDDALELALDIAAMLKDELQKEQDKQQQQQSSQGQGGQSGSSAGSQDPTQDPADAAGQGTSGDSADDQSTTGSNAKDRGKKRGPAGKSPGASQRQIDNLEAVLDPANAKDAYGDKARDIAAALQQLVRQVTREGSLGDMELNSDVLTRPLDQVTEGLLCATQPYDMAAALSVTGALRVKLIRQLQAFVEEDIRVGKRGRKVSSRHLYRLGLNDPRVFRTLDEEQDLNTAIALMIDVSGSMYYPPQNGDEAMVVTASKALYATACAMEALDGVDVAVGTFPFFQLVKPFALRARPLSASFSLRATGNTPMAHGVQFGQRLLQSSRRTRKMLIMITDGDPDNVAETRMAIMAAQRAGLEVYGLGIATDSGQSFFPRWQTITSVADLPDKLMHLLNHRLLAQAA
ncbi:MAG: VWA domain-containing protein [Sulfuricaulis sp.]